MACEAPIGSQLDLRKPNEIPLEEQPELKKPKLESENEGEDDEWWRNDAFYADNKDGLHEMNPNEWKQYIDHINKSGGFDVPEFPNSIFYGIQPCYEAFSEAWTYGEVKESSIFATQEHNKKEGTNYAYYRFTKVNMEPVGGVIYYITYLAEDLNSVDSGPGYGSSNLEKVPVGPNGARLVELQAKVFYPIPDKEGKINMDVMYFHVNDTICEEGYEVLRQLKQLGKR